MKYARGLYFKSAPEMAVRFPERTDVLENTLKVADEAGSVLGGVIEAPWGRATGDYNASFSHGIIGVNLNRSLSLTVLRDRCRDRTTGMT